MGSDNVKSKNSCPLEMVRGEGEKMALEQVMWEGGGEMAEGPWWPLYTVAKWIEFGHTVFNI